MTMNINEMESLAKANSGLISWPCNIPADSILELISAYREAVAALGEIYSINASKHGTSGMMIARCINVAGNALETAKRLGVE